MSKFITGFILGLLIGLVGILAVVYYAKGDWIDFKLIVLGIVELIYKFVYAYFKYILLTIALVIGVVGAYLVWELVDINNYKKEKEAELEAQYREAQAKINNEEKRLMEIVATKQEEIENMLRAKKIEAQKIIEEAKEQAEHIRDMAYLEGQEKHKKELKALRTRLSAVRNIFKTRPELNECFKKITGWDFEKWLKER